MSSSKLNHVKKKVWLSWSSGKDSAYALSVLLNSDEFEVTGIFTTVTDNFNRVSMHSVREELLDKQAEKLKIPLYKIRIPYPCSNEIYERLMKEFVEKAKSNNITHMAFGDLYLQDIRDYRVRQLVGTNIEPIFPIWNLPTKEVSEKIVKLGYKAVVTCIDDKKLDPDFSGRDYNFAFLASLPENVDPCGENGEFHSFVYDCPMFYEKIDIAVGDKKSSDGFTFRDILLKENRL